MNRHLLFLWYCLILFGIACANAGKTRDLALCDSITKDGVTWRFASPIQVGQFVTGDYYVVGKATVISITPNPAGGRNGSVCNPPLAIGSGFDDRVIEDRFREQLRVYPPLSLNPGDVLLSSISIDSLGSIHSWLKESEVPLSPVKSISILTCLEHAVTADAFRPSYGDTTCKLYYADSLRRYLLPKLKSAGEVPNISEFTEHFRRPWVDICQFSFDVPVEYQPAYGREVGRAVGMASLMLMLDIGNSEKETLLIGLVQYGIDLWGIIRNGYDPWVALGGHGSGRKWPVIFAGILLGDTAMAQPTRTYPDMEFSEDMQTIYGSGWTGATALYAGHMGVHNGQPVSTKEGWGPYEHLQPSEWVNNLGEEYRRCCTSIAWIGEALAARLMGAIDKWNHPPFFDYCDRWMTEDDSEYVQIIKNVRGWDFSAQYMRQRQCWDIFVEQMWAKYRTNSSVKTSLIPFGQVLPRQRALFMLAPDRRKALSMLRELVKKYGEVTIFQCSGKTILRVTKENLSDCNTIFARKPTGIYYLEFQKKL